MATTNQIAPFNYNPRNTAVVSNVQEFTASGTWVKPTGVTFVMIEAWGGGGAGGAGAIAAYGNYITGGSGGGGGAYNFKTFKASDLAATAAVTVGAGGTSGSAGGNSRVLSALTELIMSYGGSGGTIGTVNATTLTYVAGGRGAGTLAGGEPAIISGATVVESNSHFGNNNQFSGANSGWAGAGGGGLNNSLAGTVSTVQSGGASVSGGCGGGNGASWNNTSFTATPNGGSVSQRGQNSSNPTQSGCNGVDGVAPRQGGNGGGAGNRAPTSAYGGGIAAAGTRLVVGGTTNAFTTFTTTDSGVTILNAQSAYDSGVTSVQTPIRALAYSSSTSLFYGFYRNNSYKKIWSSSNGLTWTFLFDFSPIIANSSTTILDYTIQGGLHCATFNDTSLFVSTDTTGTAFTAVGVSALGFTTGLIYIAYDTTRSLWVILSGVSGAAIYTTTDFATFTAIANLPAAGSRNGIVITSAGRWIVSTAGTNIVRYTDDAGATAWTTPTSGLPAYTTGAPYIQIVNSLIVYSDGVAGLTLYSSADNGATFAAVAAPPTRQTPEVAWDGTNYAVTLNGTASLALIATSLTLGVASVWTTRSVTSPVLTAGGAGGAGAAPSGGGGGGGAALTGTVGGVANVAGVSGPGARGLVRIYSW